MLDFLQNVVVLEVGVLQCALACGATISPCAFEGCIRLAQTGLPRR